MEFFYKQVGKIMVIRTKKYKLNKGTYIQLGLRNIYSEQWWIFLIALAIMSGTLFVKTYWFILISVLGLILYSLFWVIQFYGITQLEQNQLFFQRLAYEATNQHLIAQLTTKQGMPIAWSQIQRVWRGKAYFVFVISKVHIIHLPYRIFHSPNEVKFLTALLQRKGLIK